MGRRSYKEVQEAVFLNAGAQKDGEWTAGIHPGSSADSGPDLMQREVNVWPLMGYVVRG